MQTGDVGHQWFEHSFLHCRKLVVFHVDTEIACKNIRMHIFIHLFEKQKVLFQVFEIYMKIY